VALAAGATIFRMIDRKRNETADARRFTQMGPTKIGVDRRFLQEA